MKLEIYLKTMAIKQKDFAEAIGETPACINNYAGGDRVPKPDVMVKIYQATGGMVEPNDFYDLKKGEEE